MFDVYLTAITYLHDLLVCLPRIESVVVRQKATVEITVGKTDFVILMRELVAHGDSPAHHGIKREDWREDCTVCKMAKLHRMIDASPKLQYVLGSKIGANFAVVLHG